MNFNQTITISPDLIAQEVSGETVILDLESDHYYGLDDIGTQVWRMLQEPRSLREIYGVLLDEYEATGEQLTIDLNTLLQELEELGLISVSRKP